VPVAERECPHGRTARELAVNRELIRRTKASVADAHDVVAGSLDRLPKGWKLLGP
jgi:hypothetical protein